VKITVEIDEFEPDVRVSHAVADYVRVMLKVWSLRRAVAEALLEAEYCKKRLKGSQLLEARTLLDEKFEQALRLRKPPLLRRLTKRPATKDRD
jgi:hypothetical protein